MIGVKISLEYKNERPDHKSMGIDFKCDYYEYASTVYEETKHKVILLKGECVRFSEKGNEDSGVFSLFAVVVDEYLSKNSISKGFRVLKNSVALLNTPEGYVWKDITYAKLNMVDILDYIAESNYNFKGNPNDRSIDMDITRLLTYNLGCAVENLSLRYRKLSIEPRNSFASESFVVFDKGGELDKIYSILDKYAPEGNGSDISPVPLNFIVDASRYSCNGFPDYIADKLIKIGCMWNNGIAVMGINTKTKRLPCISEFNRCFAGWTLLIELEDFPSIDIVNELVLLLSGSNTKDICLVVDVSKCISRNKKQIISMISDIKCHNWYVVADKALPLNVAAQYAAKKYKERYPKMRFRFDWKKILSKEPVLTYDACDGIVANQVRLKLNKKYGFDKMSNVIIPPDGPAGMANADDKSVDNNIDSVDPFEELNGLIGLKNVKEYVTRAISHHRMSDIYKKNGMNVSKPSYNMAFFGNPGTAKTTCARLIGKIFYKEGIIKSPKMMEITRENLCGGYVGETAIKTKKLLNEVKSGVIFIDEAYSLSYSENSGDYGNEAINELVAAMDSRKDVVFIFAGYKNEMRRFIESNPGLSSRVPNNIEFSDYTKEELMTMLTDKFNSQGFVLDDKVSEYFSDKIENDMNDSHFGNGRYIRTMVEQSILEHSVRLNIKGEYNIKDINTITEEDVPDMVKLAKDKSPVGFGL